MSNAAPTTELVAAPPRTLAAARGAGVQGLFGYFKAFAGQPAVAKSLPALGLIGVIAAAAIIWMTFSTGPSRDLFRGLPDQDKASVAEALQTAGIRYKIDRDSGALSVSDGDFYQARMLLAQQGLPRSAPDGESMIDKLTLGSSRAVETERLRSAREIDLARTIEAIDSVQSARVHLAVEAPSAFLRDEAKPSASVMLRMASGRSLGDNQVQAIVHLVASSVNGLAPESVSVVDQNGRLLSSAGDGGAGAVSDRQVEVQNRIEDKYRRQLVALLTPIVGEGNFTTEVHADVDFSETEATREGFPKPTGVITAEQGSVTTDGSGSGSGAHGASGGAGAGHEASGIPGALSNQAPPAAQVSAAPGGTVTPVIPGATDAATAATREENYNRSYAVGREVSVTREQPGQVKRLSVAVALKNPSGKARTKEEMAAIEGLVKGAVGYDSARGDVVAISGRNFAAIEQTKASWWEAGWVSLLARNLTALALAVLFIFGIGRPLLRKGSAMLTERAKVAKASKSTIGAEMVSAMAVEAMLNPNARITLGMIEAANSYESRAALIRNFVRQDPARAALVVRDLIRTDKDGVEKNG